MGDFLPAKLNFDENERPVFMKVIKDGDMQHNMVYIFENGKGIRVPLSAYQTKSNRKKLTSAFNVSSPVVGIFFEDQPFGVMITNNAEKAIVLNSELIPQKSTRTSVGVLLMKLRPKQIVVSAKRGFEESLANVARYTKTKIPASGTVLEEKDLAELQISLL